jgi:hypothetical protein
VAIYEPLLALICLHDVQLFVLRRPGNYPDDFRLIVRYKSVSIQLGKYTNKILTLRAFLKSLSMSSKRIYVFPAGEGEREGEDEGERECAGEEEEELLPDRSELSLSLLLDPLAERER